VVKKHIKKKEKKKKRRKLLFCLELHSVSLHQMGGGLSERRRSCLVENAMEACSLSHAKMFEMCSSVVSRIISNWFGYID
jgi:hypothetical protein